MVPAGRSARPLLRWPVSPLASRVCPCRRRNLPCRDELSVSPPAEACGSLSPEQSICLETQAARAVKRERPLVDAASFVGSEPTLPVAAVWTNGGFGGSRCCCSIVFRLGEPPPVLHVESTRTVAGNPLRESASGGVGISAALARLSVRRTAAIRYDAAGFAARRESAVHLSCFFLRTPSVVAAARAFAGRPKSSSGQGLWGRCRAAAERCLAEAPAPRRGGRRPRQGARFRACRRSGPSPQGCRQAGSR